MGNLTDKIKHANLTSLVNKLELTTYVEFHSGPGQVKNGDNLIKGSVLQVCDAHNFNKIFLHEIDETKQSELKNTLEEHEINATLRGNWKTDVDEYIAKANGSWLILIDPTYIKDYSEITPYLGNLGKTGANMFLYVPQTVRAENHKTMLQDIFDAIPKPFVDLKHPTIKGGHHKRIEHNIVVAQKQILEELANEHVGFCEKYNYKTFRDFKDFAQFYS